VVRNADLARTDSIRTLSCERRRWRGGAVDEYHRAGLEITNGNPEVYKALYSRSDDVTLANPFGPPTRGWSEVSATLDRAAENYRDGEAVGFQNVSTVITPELGYTGAGRARSGVPFISDADLETALDNAHVSSKTTDAALDAYRDARIAGLRSALAILAVLAIVARPRAAHPD
jgi:hypothetical protein